MRIGALELLLDLQSNDAILIASALRDHLGPQGHRTNGNITPEGILERTVVIVEDFS